MAVTAANPDAAIGTPPAAGPLDRLREAFERLNNQQKMILLVTLAAIVALVVGAILWSRQPDYKVLFSNLGDKDGGAIVTALEQQNIPHKMSDSGAILVPSDRVHEVRLKLASQGLPRGGSVGFELMENQKFGISQFAEQVNYQRGLEGELARTIQSIGAVQSARVHLAIPKPSVFVREEQKPTASVMLNLYPGRSLDAGQIAGITHLVAASVPQLPTSNVTVIDQSGALLSQLKSKLTEAGLDPAQIKYVREVEDSIIKRIEEILKPMLGPENYKVQVAADVDFSHVEQTAESYTPNGNPANASIRSQQSSETANVNQATGGVPGALTNQPPVPATAPLTAPNVGGTPGQPARPGEPGKLEAAGITAPLQTAGHPVSTAKNATINYEIDKTVRYTKQALGTVRRLSAAVVVNHRKEPGKDGKLVAKPLPEAEMKQINDVVREAMGFSKDRGDTLSIANSPFTAPEKTEVSVPLWKDPENIAFAKELVKYLLIAAVIAYLLIKVVQPIIRTMFPSAEQIAEAEREALALAGGLPGVEEGEEQVEINHYAAKVEKAREIAQNDPKVVANIIKDWMGANGNA